MKNEKLAIAIPTYNRAEILKENLLHMMDDIKKYNIPIYISDDSNNDDTKMIITELKSDYEYIYYHKNEPSLGHDKNCFATLNLADTDFIWYLGDSMFIKKDSIGKIVDILNTFNPDLIFVNTQGRDLNIESGIQKDKNEILLYLGWHLTQTGATIYSKESLANVNKLNLDKIKNFPQFALIFSFLNENKKAFWINDKLVFINNKKMSYWDRKVFEVFLSDWINVVNSLDESYTKTNKEQCILNHSHKTNLFTITAIMRLRAYGAYNKYVFHKYKVLLCTHSHLPCFVLYITSIFPKIFLLALIKFKRAIG